MAARVTCANCGATNVADAQWCGQCYESLGRDEPPEPKEDSEPQHPSSNDGALEDASWTCPICGETNALEVEACGVCGTSLFDAFAAKRERADPQTALRYSIVPGLGLAKVGMGGEGVIVMLLVAFSVLGGIAIMFAGEAIGVLVVIVGVGIWVAAARDAVVVAQEGRDVAWLKPRALTIAAIVVLAVTAMALLRALPGSSGV